VSLYYQDEAVTLYHGDCLEILTWLDADVLVTDPPYGMAYISGYRHRDDMVAVAGDTSPVTRDAALSLWGDRPAIAFGTWRVPRPAATRQVITWHKTSIGPGMGDLSLPWGTATEEVYVLGSGWVGKRRANYIATSDQRGGTVGVAALIGHPTPKPVGLLEQLIECAPSGVIADPFAGGGSTLLAARNLGRKAIGVEIEERYCEVIAKRLAQGVLL
jgi:site-specific DNA-methyltransferase (adenine-specific)